MRILTNEEVNQVSGGYAASYATWTNFQQSINAFGDAVSGGARATADFIHGFGQGFYDAI